ncbi:hypothetical protein G7Z17_g1594 [Cylindrodendrum hubeiense]|uniref:Uncharacterized protein n=1 Tax=Cylindrodendrum hubeiense TaxID=595255 RepID=A0A9P5LLV6_9HYPO|nr:hypothetical protein G7Z17_g1594 [Cylindrodendrum hubeiense]
MAIRPGKGQSPSINSDENNHIAERFAHRGDANEAENAAMIPRGPDNAEFRGLRATKRPLKKLAFAVLSGWFVTVVLSLSIFVVLYVYSNKPVMSKKVKRQFNAIITGLAIALGLAIASNLNGMVGDLRWWILSRRYRSRRKVELIMEADRGTGRRRLTGYGTVSIAYDMGDMDQIPGAGMIWSPGDSLMFCADTTCRYVFHETSTESILNLASNPTVATTSRSVDTSAICNSWPVTSGGDGTETNITVVTDDGPVTVFIPVAGGIDQTTFMTNTSETCGFGCSSIYAFEASTNTPWYYECNITVSKVANATRSEHKLSADLTSIVSGAIALQGYEASSLANITDIQYQAFPAESIFGTPVNGSVVDLAFLLARFTIGVIAATADNNDLLSIEGMAPEVGSELDVTHWSLVIAILILLAGLQLILGVTSALVANRVVVPEGGAVAVTQVLRAMANQSTHEERGRSMKGSMKGSERKTLWIYRDTKVSEDGVYDLHMEEDSFVIKESSDLIEMPSRTATGDETVSRRLAGYENKKRSRSL